VLLPGMHKMLAGHDDFHYEDAQLARERGGGHLRAQQYDVERPGTNVGGK
jgi:hypothetical protein